VPVPVPGLAPPVEGPVAPPEVPLVPPEDGAVAPEEVVGVGAVVATDEAELVVELVVVVLTAAFADAPVGTVSCGAPTVSEVADPEPHAARVAARMTPTTNAETVMSGRVMVLGGRQEPSGSMRLPQTGQSLRSF
jgi:hypothetical protein